MRPGCSKMEAQNMLKFMFFMIAIIGVIDCTSSGAFPSACKTKSKASKSITLKPLHPGIKIIDKDQTAVLR